MTVDNLDPGLLYMLPNALASKKSAMRMHANFTAQKDSTTYCTVVPTQTFLAEVASTCFRPE